MSEAPVTYELAIGNARRLLEAAEQETDRQLMECLTSLGDSWINVAALAMNRERGNS